MKYIGKRHGYSYNQKVYVRSVALYGRIKQYRGGLFRVAYLRGGEVWVRPYEIENGE